jgi:hypothetical protein
MPRRRHLAERHEARSEPRGERCDGVRLARWSCFSRARARAREATRAWHERCGTRPSCCDWSRTHGAAAAASHSSACHKTAWPAVGTVTDLYGTWAKARGDAFAR